METRDERMGLYAKDTTSFLGESTLIERQYLPEVNAPEKTEYTCDVLADHPGCAEHFWILRTL